MQKKQNFKELSIKDLESTAAFEKWIKESLNFKYQDSDEIPKDHLIIYLDYIENKVKESQESIDKKYWFKMMIELRKRINLIKEDKNELS